MRASILKTAQGDAHRRHALTARNTHVLSENPSPPDRRAKSLAMCVAEQKKRERIEDGNNEEKADGFVVVC